jgi:NhaA family Na+:H+ antiporter
MWWHWAVAGLICILLAAFEAIAAGRNPAATLRSIRQPRWSPPFWAWAIIGGAWYLICFVSLALLIPSFDTNRAPVLLLVALMAANGAAGMLQMRMKRFDLALWTMLPYAAVLLIFLSTLWPQHRVPFILFAAYAVYLGYAGAWGWSLWRLNPGGGASAEPRKRGEAISAIRRFFETEAAGGLLLIGAAALALIAANGGLADLYHRTLQAEAGPALSPHLGPMTVHLWINDGLMALFFLLVGLEIKREFVGGSLSTWDRRQLPLIAAAAGMIVPAFVYLALAAGEPALRNGWAIPAATDIAFALGILALLGSRVPTSLKLFLTTVAIADDLGAVAIIAVAYTDALNLPALAAAAAITLALYAFGRVGGRALWVFLFGAAALWYAMLLSGVHPAIAGVLAAATIPAGSPLHRLEHALAPWVGWLILPLFGFANAGVSLAGLGLAALLAPLPLGIAAGLFLGKQIGIFGAVRLSVKLGFAGRPGGATWLQVYGISLLCGIGFTMSLFIGALAFPGDPALIEEAKAGILLGSVVSAVTGYLVLRLAPLHREDGE